MPLLIAADLARRGFRVSAESASTSTGPDERRLRLIDDAPDFILVLTTGDLDGCGDPADSMRREIARALETNRNIVRVTVSPAVSSIDSPFPPGLEALAASQTITYDPARGKESLALLSHRLSSDAAVDERGVMRRARRIFAAAALAIVAILAIEGVPVLLRNLAGGPEARPLPPLAVYWSIFGQRQGPDGWSAFAVAEGSPVVAGDQVRLVFSPSADGCAYVLARDARKDVSVLFPTQALRAASRVRAGERYSAPVETDWLTVEEGAGLEAIYLFASYDPIENLEELVEERDGRSPQQARLALVETTIQGLLDGRHGAAPGRILTRSRRPIVGGLGFGPGPAVLSATLSNGTLVTDRPTLQPGLLSAVVEIPIGPGRPR